MRMKLYKIEVVRQDGKFKFYVLAPSAAYAEKLIKDQSERVGVRLTRTTMERVDHKLPENMRWGLDELLDQAPMGFATYLAPIGWFLHTPAVQRRRLFKIEDETGERVYVIAPNVEFAKTIYFHGYPLAPGETRDFTICDVVDDLPAEQVANLHSLLAFGPLGIVIFDPQHGWTAW